MHLIKALLFVLVSAFIISCPAHSEESPSVSSYSTIVSTPIFSQNLVHGLPSGWKLVNSGKANRPEGMLFSLNYALDGQTPANWTELITVTGFKNLAQNANATPKALIGKMAGQKESVCPGNSVVASGGDVAFGEVRGHVAVLGCGKLPNDLGGMKAGEGEIGVYIVLKGANDMYVIQRMQRVASFEPKSQPITPQVLGELLQSFFPIGLCELTDTPNECQPKLGGNK
ncbi:MULTISPECIES: hypothetical protein [unclassified Methylophilus]|uniref:hypothetical protein n=1 Tax=unclassified Methylophilus TaxID=2630143 RepID=UPI001E5AD4F3|nr:MULTISPECIES: hypothetical protein [unclassified Methylophilus]